MDYATVIQARAKSLSERLTSAPADQQTSKTSPSESSTGGRQFSSALLRGQAAERRWVEEIRSGGRSACHGKKLVIQNHDKNQDHVDSPDAVALVSVEIKERRFAFTSPDDWPYPTVIVDDLRGLALETLRHYAYVYVSQKTGEWVWLSSLDRNEDWKEDVTFDRGRGHEVPILTAPKSHLRPASQLTCLIYPHTLLELVDGATDAFRKGGGATESRERCPPSQTV
jgi:hypothetical protein